MKLLIKILFLVLLATGISHAQHTTVTAQVKDPTGVTYRTCSGSANFVGQNTTPGAPPYTLGGGAFQTVVPISCDGAGRFQISLADNNIITPNPSQWRFSICSGTGVYPGPPICFNALITITGVSQDVTTSLQAVSAPLPPYSVTLETNGVLNGSQALLNLISGSNIAIVDNGLGGVTISSSGGGGGPGGLPDPGSNGIVVRTALNTTAAVPNAAIGSYYVSEGVSSLPATQQKAIYDTRDWMTCDGSTDASTGMHNLLTTIGTSEATIRFIGSTLSTNTCRIGNTLFPANVSLDFSGGGAIQLISSSTSPGGAGFVNGTSVECGSGTTCTTPAVSLTAGNTLVVMDAPYPGFTFKITSITDSCGDFFIHVFQSLANQPRNQGAWVASSIAGGSCTITATANGSLTNNTMIAAQFSGLGPVASLDTTASSNAIVNPMSSGAATVTAGSLAIGFGGQPFTTETCTAGAGFTQPANPVGQTASGFMCMEYQLSAAGGSLTATQNITTLPANQVYSLVALKPGNAQATIWGGIINPDMHKIFYNAEGTTGHGNVDFTGATTNQTLYPEWWGATQTDTTGTTNTPEIQAAVWAAFGGGPTPFRKNGDGLTQYNRELKFVGQYTINAELQFFHVSGFLITGVERLASGLVQGASNAAIIRGDGISYGEFRDISFSTSSSQDTAHPLVDLDWTGTLAADLHPQFIDFNHVNFVGNGVAAIGVLIAKSGGGAQGSNIYCRDCESISFTTAAWQIGQHNIGATNALSIGYSGDIQGCPLYGIAVYGGGYVSFGDGVEEATMENGFSTQTGFDMYCEVTQGPCSMDYMRSESRRLISGTDIVLRKTRMINQAAYLPPGQTFPVGSLMTGSGVGGDGAFYKVTVNSSAAGGAGTPSAALRASSGTATTLTDTNQTVAGSVTIKAFTVGETLTQAVTGSTATLLNLPASTGSVSGTNTAGQFVVGETATQATSGVTAVVQSPTPNLSNPTLPLIMNNFSGTADNSHVWTGGTSGATYSPSAAPVFSVASPVMLITAATGAPDNSHTWTGGSSGAVYTPTGAPVNEANFTVNAFTGFFVSVLTGQNAGCYGTVTSNTAQTITFTAGWTTRYAKLGCDLLPNTGSTYVVEPGWNHGTVVSGGITMVYLNENAIDCQTVGGVTAGCTPVGRLEDVVIAGGQVRMGLTSKIDNLQVYRQDWYDNSSGGSPQQCCDLSYSWDVNIASTVAPAVVPYQGLFYQSWNLPGITGVSYSGAFQQRLGTRTLVWDTGTIGTSVPPANTSANSVWIGGRSDPSAGTDATRNILEFGGMLGRGAPLPAAANSFNPLNLAGTDTDITGGPSRGSASGGAINFWTSNPGGSGTTVNSGLKRWLVSPAGHFFAGLDNTYDIGAAGANRPRNLYITGKATLGSGSTVSISTGTASNADLAGELTFSGGTTSTSYTFTGTYVSAPECVITPRFDIGSSGRIWISTLSTTTLQLSAAAAETGTVGYICIGRN